MPTNLLSMVINDENLQLEKYFCLFLVIGLTDSAASRLQYFSTLASYIVKFELSSGEIL